MMINTTAAVGRRVSQLRGERGWSQAVLAEKLTTVLDKRIEPLTVTRLEGGKRPISVDEVVALARIFEIRPGELLPEDTPLLAEMARWRSVLTNTEVELQNVEIHRDNASRRLTYTAHKLEVLQVLLDFSRSGLLDDAVVDAVDEVGQFITQPHELIALLLDAGVPQLVLDSAGHLVNDTFHGQAETGVQSAFFSAAVAKQLAGDNGAAS